MKSTKQTNIMKTKIFTTLLCLLISYSAFSQTVLLNEDFDSGTLPTNWYIDDHNSSGETWTFVNHFSWNGTVAAIFDSDAYGSGTLNEDCSLVSEPFDASSYSEVLLTFDHHYPYAWDNTSYEVEVFDGTSWHRVLYGTNGIVFPQTETIDINSLSNSMYIIQAEYTNGEIKTHKFLKQ